MKNWISTAALLAAATAAQAGVVWDEAGGTHDLSDDRLAPTFVTMAVGHNIVLGTTGNAGAGIDRDYFSFVVPTGAVLQALVLLPNTAVSGDSSFLALQAGPQVTVTPTGGGDGPAALYGLVHYRNDQIGQNLLPQMVFGAATAPAPAGTYSVWLQELGGTVGYGLDFVITSAVPEPATALSLSLGLLGLACRRFVLQRR